MNSFDTEREGANADRHIAPDLASPNSLMMSDEGTVLVSKLDCLINWNRKSSIWYLLFGLACCGIELMQTGGPRADVDRFGFIPRATPRQADLMVVAGTLTYKMALRAKLLYDQMPEPKWVIAMGVCSSSGGMYDSYAVVQGVDSILPVDIYVPGCPPRPDAVIDAILKLQTRIERESPTRSLAGQHTERAEEGSGQLVYQPNAGVPDAVQDGSDPGHAPEPARDSK